MPALTFKIFFLFLPVRHVEHALCCGTSFVYPVICQAPNLEQHTERTHPKLLPLEAVLRRKGKMWAIAFSNKATFMNKTHPYILN